MEQQVVMIDEPTCVELLDLECVGRAAFVVGDVPYVEVVAYARHGGVLEIGAAAGSALAGLTTGEAVALQIDRVDRDLMRGWSVVAAGACLVGAPLGDGSRSVALAWTSLTGRWLGRVGAPAQERVDRLVGLSVAAG